MRRTTTDASPAGPAPERVVVLRALHLGDLLCAVPAFRAMRRAWPRAELTLAGLPWARAFVARFHHLLDRFVEFPGIAGFPEQPADPARLEAFLRDMQAQRYDLAIQMQGDGTIANDLVLRFGAAEAAGFCLPGEEPASGRFSTYPEQVSEVHRWVLLAALLGARPRGDELEFPLEPDDEVEARRLLAETGLTGNYVCLHPGARDPERRWAPEGFAAVADALAARGLRTVLTGQGVEEREIARRVKDAARLPIVDLSGETSLGGAAALVRGARLLVCNDTGVSHLAAALDVPSVVVFRTTDPVRWAPLDRRRHRVVMEGGQTLSHVMREAGDLLDREDFRAA